MQTLRDYPAATRQPAEVTTGTVWTEALAQTGSPAVLVNRAHFSPGARTCWHRHERGQTLIIESGLALVQEEGGPSSSSGRSKSSSALPESTTGTGRAPTTR